MKITLGTALLLGGAAALLALGGCDSITGEESSSSPIKLIGTSGNEVSINGTWSRGCTGGGNFLSANVFKLDGSKMTGTFQEFSPATDCSGQAAVTSGIVAKASYDQPVTMTGWVDGSGNPSTPPGSLTTVENANGTTFELTEASATPETAAVADEWNLIKQCGFNDWAPGVTKKDLVTCFLGGSANPSKSTIVVDDTTSTTTLSWYESAVSVAVTANYPTEIENFDPLQK